jgi:hypothetical protein
MAQERFEAMARAAGWEPVLLGPVQDRVAYRLVPATPPPGKAR